MSKWDEGLSIKIDRTWQLYCTYILLVFALHNAKSLAIKKSSRGTSNYLSSGKDIVFCVNGEWAFTDDHLILLCLTIMGTTVMDTFHTDRQMRSLPRHVTCTGNSDKFQGKQEGRISCSLRSNSVSACIIPNYIPASMLSLRVSVHFFVAHLIASGYHPRSIYLWSHVNVKEWLLVVLLRNIPSTCE